MARSKRENLLIIGVAAAVGIFALDHFVISPYATAREAIAKERETALKKIVENNRLFHEERDMRRLWSDMSKNGVTDAPPETERKMLHALRQWAQDAGVTNLSLRPERTNREYGFVKVVVHANGSAPQAAAAKLLWSIESATLPIRVDEIQLTPAKEGTDDLQVQLTASVLCVSTDADKNPEPAAPKPLGGASRLVEDRP
jgi:hypothetical protein